MTPPVLEPSLLEVRDLWKSFRRSGVAVPAVADATLTLARGETLGLVGPSGSGKSTLARLVMRLLAPDAGTVRFEGEDLLVREGAALRALRPRFQMVFQNPLAAFNPRTTVGAAIADPLRIHRLAPRRARGDAVAALLASVGLSADLAGRAIHEVSGGQRQRVALARALASKPSLIVLDEAVSALDVSVRAQILELLVDVQQRSGVGYLFVSHDIAVVRRVAHRVAVMDAGRIVETGLTGAVIAAPRAPTTQALVAAVPQLHVGPLPPAEPPP